MDNPEKLATFGTQDIGRRQTKLRGNQEWTIHQMLSVSLDCPFLIAPQFCLSSSYVLCTKCCQFLWIVHSCLLLLFSLPFTYIHLH
jgi:hypothetical protein